MNQNSITDMVYIGKYARRNTVAIRQDLTYIAGDILIEGIVFGDTGKGFDLPNDWIAIDKGRCEV